jgi:hypothetical protein
MCQLEYIYAQLLFAALDIDAGKGQVQSPGIDRGRSKSKTFRGEAKGPLPDISSHGGLVPAGA